MSLSNDQQHLGKALSIIEIYCSTMLGYDLVREDAYRNPVAHGDFGIKGSYASANSVHKVKLAQDYTVHKNGSWITGAEADVVFSLMHDMADLLGLAERIVGDLGHFSMRYLAYR